jgi:hypothetical protein
MMRKLKPIKRMFPAAMAVMFTLISNPESIIGYIIVFCASLIIFWLFDAPENEPIDEILDKINRKSIDIDVPIESDKTTGINLKKK